MRRDGDRFHGPGIADMKAGGYLAFKAAEPIAGLVHQPSMPLTLLYSTSDEEIGSPTSRVLCAEGDDLVPAGRLRNQGEAELARQPLDDAARGRRTDLLVGGVERASTACSAGGPDQQYVQRP